MIPHTPTRLIRALRRDGLDAAQTPWGWRARRLDAHPDTPDAEVLLPAALPLEGAALGQLAALADARHPHGGRVTHARASPDFHPGSGGVPIGATIRVEGQLLPQAVGGDINCGMRLHALDLDASALRGQRDAFVARMRGDYFAGARDLPQRGEAMSALFAEGIPGWAAATRRAGALGRLRDADLNQIEAECERVHFEAMLAGHPRWAPDHIDWDQPIIRDDGLATIGGGNHFVEIQLIEEIFDRDAAWRWGLREGQATLMIHSGSRLVGKAIGRRFHVRARARWPQDHKHPASGLFPIIDPADIADYLEAEATAANYGYLNRALLAELARISLREIHGDLQAPLIYDLPHNITQPDGDGWIARKGACPAEADQPVIIPGSMGAASYLMRGLGAAGHLRSASHGAGRATGRFHMHRREAEALGLEGIDCVTPRQTRLIEEAPAAYKPIQPVIESQIEAGVVAPVARLKPLLTFKA
ncbi:RtcB family protein [Myxococcota bacterium]|nr:RtcB family protein [Myxococcota bacterium]